MFVVVASDSGVQGAPRERQGERYEESNPGFAYGVSCPAALLVADGRITIVGVADLDNASAASVQSAQEVERELRRVLLDYEQRGPAAFATLTGEFAFVASTASGDVVAVRDRLGLCPLYYRTRKGEIRLSDSLDGLGGGGSYNREYIGEFIALEGICIDHTIWNDIAPVPPASVAIWRAGVVRIVSYWSAIPAASSPKVPIEDAVQEFGVLVRRAVLRQLLPEGGAWAHLSGGLDSSTVVCVAEALKATNATDRRLGGTITIVDSLGVGDDTRLANGVIERFGIRNERLTDYWPWRSDGEPAPRTDQPARDYPYYARDRRIQRIVRGAGGKVLLSGAGPDLYLPVTPAHIADLVWRGQIRQAAQELVRWTIARRSSIWRTGLRHVCVPLLRPQRDATADSSRLLAADWLTRTFWKETRMGTREQRHASGSRRGARYDGEVAWSLSHVGGSLAAWWNTMSDLPVKHPLLDQRLLTYVLQLPHSLRTNPYMTKPVLRMAMRGILPEAVRQRLTKGSLLNPRLCWAFAKERTLLEGLLRSSILADVGCIEPRRLLAAVDSAAAGRRDDSGAIYAALSLETWLTVRSGRCITDGR